MQNRRCQNGRLLVQPLAGTEQKTDSGLTLPDVQKRNKHVKALIVLADPESKARPGEYVYYHQNSATEIVLDGKPYGLIKDTNVELIESAP